VLASVALAACRLRRGHDVVVGAVVARTGERAPWGVDLARGLELAVEQQNTRGGVNGRRVGLATVDDESRDERAGHLTARLIEREAPLALFGEVSSAATERAAAAAQRRGVPFISPAATGRDVTRVGDWVFRTNLTDAEQARALARYARQTLQRRRVALVYRRSSLLHLAMADAFAQGFRGHGGEVALRDSYADDTELVRLVARVRAANADVVYAPADASDAGRMAVALRQGRCAAQVLGDDGWSSPEVRRYAQDAVVGVLYADAFTPNVPRTEVDAFVQAFRERYRALPGTFAALGFDAARWVLHAAQRAPQAEPATLRELLLGSRWDEAVAGPFVVDPRRNLARAAFVLRYERDGVGVAGTVTP
jgi:branched-chain amino acid transport system substrate-binding protein